MVCDTHPVDRQLLGGACAALSAWRANSHFGTAGFRDTGCFRTAQPYGVTHPLCPPNLYRCRRL
eukprot:13080206-Alexandrium_andersonii.AAC.1